MSPVPYDASTWRALALLALMTSVSPCAHADHDPERSEWFGTAVAQGDFNGDGYDDLAVGAPAEVCCGFASIGAVDVTYGSSAGLIASEYQFWHRDIDELNGDPKDFQYFGSALTAGDFNGDGYDDLAVGVPGDNDDEGAVNVIYGSASGLNVKAIPDQLWHQDSPNVPQVGESGDRFGNALAAGDFNDDGYADLVIGVPSEDLGSVVDAGAVEVIYGSSLGLSAPALAGMNLSAQVWSQNTANVAETGEAYDRFGASLAVGDFNSDSFDDLAVGVVDESVGTLVRAGAVHVIHGSAAGLSATTVPDQLWHQNSSGVNDVAEQYDGFGDSLAVGDFNGDTRTDLAIGAPYEGIDDAAASGAVHVLYATSTGLSATAIPDQFLYQYNDSYWVIGDGDSEPYDFFGAALAAADFNGDGYADLSIGTQGEDLTVPSVGAVAVLYGTVSGLDAFEGGSQFWSQDSSLIEDLSEHSDFFGATLAAGDFNDDGLADIAVGVPFEDIGTDPWDAGAVAVIYGSAGGLSPHLVLPDQLWTQGAHVQQ